MCGKGLRTYITSQLPLPEQKHTLREQLPEALKLAPNVAKLVLSCMGDFYAKRGKDHDKDTQMISYREASTLVLERFLLMGFGEINEVVSKEAEQAAVIWRRRLVDERGIKKASKMDARGLLLLIGCFGIPQVFKNEDVRDLIRKSNIREIKSALRRSNVLIQKIPGEKKSYFYVGHNEPKDLNWYGICEDKVVATKLDVGWIRGLGAALSDGFVLDWRSASECAKCEASDGLCGFNNSTKDFLCFCKDSTIKFDHCTFKGRILPLKLSIALSAVGTAIAVTCCVICCFRFRKLCDLCVSLTKTADQNVEANLQQYGSLAPMAYSYSDMRKMTSSFKEKLGEGGYGGVYKGNVNGHPVAVKILKASEGNGEDFINEVASISQTSHVNVVTLLGFCLNRQEKTLIYEFMPNGSFDKHIYREDFILEWEVLYKIALGIARGLEYLHRGCNSRILHFDIKPHNILVDEDFSPKISDFGLAKLCTRKESIMSTLEARGTVGYIAPEVFCRNFGGVSHKSDVYSYGMMVLEMVGGRRNYNAERSHNSEIYFPCWAYHRIVLDEELNIRDRITNEEKQIAKKMILVGLWCIQTDPLQRPAIGKVIEMLEGSLEALQIPPKPYIFSPSRSEGSSLTTLELPAAKAFSNSPLSSTFEPTASEFV